MGTYKDYTFNTPAGLDVSVIRSVDQLVLAEGRVIATFED